MVDSFIYRYWMVQFYRFAERFFIGLPWEQKMMLGDIGMIALSPCHIHCMHAQSCLALCDPMDCNPPGSSVHGLFQRRTLEWVAIPSSRESSQPKDWIHISSITCIGSQVLHQGATWEVLPCPVLSGKPSDTFTEDSTKKFKTTWVTGFFFFFLRDLSIRWTECRNEGEISIALKWVKEMWRKEYLNCL